MRELDVVGQVVGGQVGQIRIREKQDRQIELGDLLVTHDGNNNNNSTIILQVFDLTYGSQIPDNTRELMSGLNLENTGHNTDIFEPNLRNYVIAHVKALVRVDSESHTTTTPKILPSFFGKVSQITKDDLQFLSKQDDSFFVGRIRSGSKIVDVPVWLPSRKIFSHHILIPATTGRGKSNLVKTILWHVLDSNNVVGALVLDPHDEYWGRTDNGLHSHPNADENLVYYTPNSPPAGANFLTVNLGTIKPDHFNGIIEFTDPQEQALRTFYRVFRRDWIDAIIEEREHPDLNDYAKKTRFILKRKFKLALGVDVDGDGKIVCHNRVFDTGTKGTQTISQIVKSVEDGKVVIIDTSQLSDAAELLIGSIIASEILERYQQYKARGELDTKPIATIVIEEAPRVLGEDVMKNSSGNDNIFSKIAKEGRKFQVGLTAITQLSSVIPKTVLANINTKIILGNEMRQERAAVIASASQDLSDDDRNIASLDKGEAIISSIFVPFALPIKIPLFDELVSDGTKDTKVYKTRMY